MEFKPGHSLGWDFFQNFISNFNFFEKWNLKFFRKNFSDFLSRQTNITAMFSILEDIWNSALQQNFTPKNNFVLNWIYSEIQPKMLEFTETNWNSFVINMKRRSIVFISYLLKKIKVSNFLLSFNFRKLLYILLKVFHYFNHRDSSLTISSIISHKIYWKNKILILTMIK